MSLEFKVLSLTDMGRNNDDGVNVVDHVNSEIKRITKMATDGRHGRKGKITLTIDLEAANAESIKVDYKVDVKLPKKLHTGLIAYLNQEGVPTIQEALQEPLFPNNVIPGPKKAQGGGDDTDREK